ncbi:MAG: MFS transporter [Gammaproteobacteria bacterium]|nr:MFS transporter [Gammaproteobacteria bacterium]
MLGSPSRSALIPLVIPEQKLMLAASTDTASQNAAAIVGGSRLFRRRRRDCRSDGLRFCWRAALRSLPCLPLAVIIEVGGKVPQQGPPVSQMRQTRDGFGYVAKHPILPGLFLLDAGITTASFYREILPVLALGLFAGGASATGMLGAANSTGAILGSLVALLLASFRAKGMLVLYASIAYRIVLLGFGWAGSLWVGMLMIALLGGADAVTVAVRHTTVMLTTPDEMRGRAFALMILAAQTANNVGTIWSVSGWCHRRCEHHAYGGRDLDRRLSDDLVFGSARFGFRAD